MLQSAVSLPPQVAGQPKGELLVSLSQPSWTGAPPCSGALAARLRWWGDAQSGPGDLLPLPASATASPARLRFEVRSGPKYVGRYLKDCGSLVIGLEPINGSGSGASAVGTVTVGLLALEPGAPVGGALPIVAPLALQHGAAGGSGGAGTKPQVLGSIEVSLELRYAGDLGGGSELEQGEVAAVDQAAAHAPADAKTAAAGGVSDDDSDGRGSAGLHPPPGLLLEVEAALVGPAAEEALEAGLGCEGAAGEAAALLGAEQLRGLLARLLPQATQAGLAYAVASLLADAASSGHAACPAAAEEAKLGLSVGELRAAAKDGAAIEAALRGDAAEAVRPLRQAAASLLSKSLELVRAFSAAAAAASSAGAAQQDGLRRHQVVPAAQQGQPRLLWERVPALLSSLHPNISAREVRLLLALLAGAAEAAEAGAQGGSNGRTGPGAGSGVSLEQLKQVLTAVVEAQAFPTPLEHQQQQEAAAARQAQLAAAAAAKVAADHPVTGGLEQRRRVTVDWLRQQAHQRRVGTEIHASGGADARGQGDAAASGAATAQQAGAAPSQPSQEVPPSGAQSQPSELPLQEQQKEEDDPLLQLILRAERLKEAMQHASLAPAGVALPPPPLPPDAAVAAVSTAAGGGGPGALSAATAALLQAARALQAEAAAGAAGSAPRGAPHPHVLPAPVAAAPVVGPRSMARVSDSEGSDSDPAELAADVILEELYFAGAGSGQRGSPQQQEDDINSRGGGKAQEEEEEEERRPAMVLSLQLSALRLSGSGTGPGSVRCVVKPLTLPRAHAGGGGGSPGPAAPHPLQFTLPVGGAGASAQADVPVPSVAAQPALLPPCLHCELWTHGGRLLGLVRAPLLAPMAAAVEGGAGAIEATVVCAGRLQVWDPLDGVEAGSLHVAAVLKERSAPPVAASTRHTFAVSVRQAFRLPSPAAYAEARLLAPDARFVRYAFPGEPEALRTDEVPAVGNPLFDATATHQLTLPAGHDLGALLQDGHLRFEVWDRWLGASGGQQPEQRHAWALLPMAELATLAAAVAPSDASAAASRTCLLPLVAEWAGEQACDPGLARHAPPLQTPFVPQSCTPSWHAEHSYRLRMTSAGLTALATQALKVEVWHHCPRSEAAAAALAAGKSSVAASAGDSCSREVLLGTTECILAAVLARAEGLRCWLPLRPGASAPSGGDCDIPDATGAVGAVQVAVRLAELAGEAVDEGRPGAWSLVRACPEAAALLPPPDRQRLLLPADDPAAAGFRGQAAVLCVAIHEVALPQASSSGGSSPSRPKAAKYFCSLSLPDGGGAGAGLTTPARTATAVGGSPGQQQCWAARLGHAVSFQVTAGAALHRLLLTQPLTVQVYKQPPAGAGPPARAAAVAAIHVGTAELDLSPLVLGDDGSAAALGAPALGSGDSSPAGVRRRAAGSCVVVDPSASSLGAAAVALEATLLVQPAAEDLAGAGVRWEVAEEEGAEVGAGEEASGVPQAAGPTTERSEQPGAAGATPDHCPLTDSGADLASPGSCPGLPPGGGGAGSSGVTSDAPSASLQLQQAQQRVGEAALPPAGRLLVQVGMALHLPPPTSGGARDTCWVQAVWGALRQHQQRTPVAPLLAEEAGGVGGTVVWDAALELPADAAMFAGPAGGATSAVGGPVLLLNVWRSTGAGGGDGGSGSREARPGSAAGPGDALVGCAMIDLAPLPRLGQMLGWWPVVDWQQELRGELKADVSMDAVLQAQLEQQAQQAAPPGEQGGSLGAAAAAAGRQAARQHAQPPPQEEQRDAGQLQELLQQKLRELESFSRQLASATSAASGAAGSEAAQQLPSTGSSAASPKPWRPAPAARPAEGGGSSADEAAEVAVQRAAAEVAAEQQAMHVRLQAGQTAWSGSDSSLEWGAMLGVAFEGAVSPGFSEHGQEDEEREEHEEANTLAEEERASPRQAPGQPSGRPRPSLLVGADWLFDIGRGTAVAFQGTGAQDEADALLARFGALQVGGEGGSDSSGEVLEAGGAAVAWDAPIDVARQQQQQQQHVEAAGMPAAARAAQLQQPAAQLEQGAPGLAQPRPRAAVRFRNRLLPATVPPQGEEAAAAGWPHHPAAALEASPPPLPAMGGQPPARRRSSAAVLTAAPAPAPAGAARSAAGAALGADWLFDIKKLAGGGHQPPAPLPEPRRPRFFGARPAGPVAEPAPPIVDAQATAATRVPGVAEPAPAAPGPGLSQFAPSSGEQQERQEQRPAAAASPVPLPQWAPAAPSGTPSLPWEPAQPASPLAPQQPERPRSPLAAPTFDEVLASFRSGGAPSAEASPQGRAPLPPPPSPALGAPPAAAWPTWSPAAAASPTAAASTAAAAVAPSLQGSLSLPAAPPAGAEGGPPGVQRQSESLPPPRRPFTAGPSRFGPPAGGGAGGGRQQPPDAALQ
eukprot:scaffold9.g3132.t1